MSQIQPLSPYEIIKNTNEQNIKRNKETKINHIKKTNEFFQNFYDDLCNNKYPEFSKKIYDYFINNNEQIISNIINSDEKYIIFNAFNYNKRDLKTEITKNVTIIRTNFDSNIILEENEIMIKNNYSEYIESLVYSLSNYNLGYYCYKITNPQSILNGFELIIVSTNNDETQFNKRCYIYITITKPTPKSICNIL